MEVWEERVERAAARYEDGAARLPEEPDERQRQLTRMGNAAWAAGLSRLMLGRRAEAEEWLLLAASTYRESWSDAPPGSWGRPIGAMKSRLIAGDHAGARVDATWALEAGAARSESPIGRYAATLALLALGDDRDAAASARTLAGADAIPPAVTDSLVALASGDQAGYEAAIEALVTDFEAREEFLEDIPVADTVLAFQALARERGLEIQLASRLLPGQRPGPGSVVDRPRALQAQLPGRGITGQTNEGPLPVTTAVPAANASASSASLSRLPLPLESEDATAAAYPDGKPSSWTRQRPPL